MVFFKFHRRAFTTEDYAPYNRQCCSKASKTQETDDAVIKFSASFSLSILLQNKEKFLKKGLQVSLTSHFRKEAMALFKPFG